MTLVITIMADDNARNRRRARRAAQREQAMQDTTLARKVARSASGTQRVIRATSLEFPRDYVAGESGMCLPEIALFAAGHRKSKQVTAR